MIQNEFIQIIKHLFEIFSNSIFVINANKSYTFGEIYQQSLQVSSYLNSRSNRKLNVALIANNSVEWIICFFGILFSKHHLVLFSPNLSTEKVRHVVMDAKIDILINGICGNFELPEVYSPKYLLFISKNESVDLSQRSSEGIFIYSPNSLKPHFLSFNYSILGKMKEIATHELFLDRSNYYQSRKLEFTYNYIICLLLPLSKGCKIHLDGPIDTFDSTIVTTGHEFEKSYKAYIENPTSFFDNILKSNRWMYFIRKRVVKNRLNKLFPSLYKLIILNSYVSLDIEEILKDINYPVIFTYGKVEDCGINITDGPIMYNIEERRIKSFMFVKDCMLIPVDRTGGWKQPEFPAYNLIISIDWNEVEYYELRQDEVELTLRNNLKALSYGKEISVKIIPGDFKRDLYGRPQSPMYR